ncbi:MAG TPA: LUD domain-containing protein [Ktedonobacterales bacterium]|nr:LUD domain-containing protein [Ktedonobacterales bacterium]
MTESAKDAILARIRAAVNGAPESAAPPRDYRQQDERPGDAIIAELVDRLRDYKARVETVEAAALPAAVADACASYNVHHLVVPADTPADWTPAGIEVHRDDPPLTHTVLDHSDAVLTGCALAIAQTGTIVLNGGERQGRRVLSLVPDCHLCVVDANQVVGIVPEGIAQLTRDPTRPITFISGPSATSDIELSRVEGVHGPRTLHVFVVLHAAAHR